MALMSKKELSKLKNHMAEYAKLKKENAELKEMLKYVLNDIKIREKRQNNCFYCAYKAGCEGFFCCFKYKYEDEIKKLIGEEHESKI